MKSSVQGLIAIVLFGFLTGCTTTPTPQNSGVIHLTVHSDISGAAVYEGNKYFGATPVALQYSNAVFRNGGCINTNPITLRWGSGATVTQPVHLCASTGYYQQYTFNRPLNVPGRDRDLQFAIEMERNAAIRQQAAAASDAALIQAWSAVNALSNSGDVNINANCRSYMIGDTVHTKCD